MPTITASAPQVPDSVTSRRPRSIPVTAVRSSSSTALASYQSGECTKISSRLALPCR